MGGPAASTETLQVRLAEQACPQQVNGASPLPDRPCFFGNTTTGFTWRRRQRGVRTGILGTGHRHHPGVAHRCGADRLVGRCPKSATFERRCIAGRRQGGGGAECGKQDDFCSDPGMNLSISRFNYDGFPHMLNTRDECIRRPPCSGSI